MDNIITGLLLGDGYIHKPKGTANTYFVIKNVNVEYIFWLSKVFNRLEIGTNCSLETQKGGFEGSKMSSLLTTRSSAYFRNLWLKWYEPKPNGYFGKTLPDGFYDVTINRDVLLHWFIGDGYAVHLKGKLERVQFATDRYSIEHNHMLIEMLKRDIGIKISYDSNRNRLRVPKSQLPDFYDFLGECPKDIENCLGYKWY
jgi:hypothetical protein